MYSVVVSKTKQDIRPSKRSVVKLSSQEREEMVKEYEYGRALHKDGRYVRGRKKGEC